MLKEKKLVMAVLIQKWTHTPSGKTAEMKQVCPWGICEHISKLLSEERCKE